MFARIHSKNDVDYLDGAKKPNGDDYRVFKLKCSMLELKKEDWNKYPSVQYSCKCISDWNVVISCGSIVAWADEVDNVYLFYLDPETKNNSITKAVCNVRGDNAVCIKFIPENFRYVTADETGTIKSVAQRMAIEISTELDVGDNSGSARYIGYFYSDNTEELMAFADEIVSELIQKPGVLDDFDWYGEAYEAIRDFK